MKRLNRIQSIVFETAYNTNENMLICAPTGAGKTNIAMLTVLHEIRQHFQQGVIKKNEFKVGDYKSDSSCFIFSFEFVEDKISLQFNKACKFLKIFIIVEII